MVTYQGRLNKSWNGPERRSQNDLKGSADGWVKKDETRKHSCRKRTEM